MSRGRVVVWFSCGITSAVAARRAVERYRNTHELAVYYCDTRSEHPDNKRFLEDVSEWIEHPIESHRSPDYANIWDVFNRTRWLVGPKGARCTTELKKKVRRSLERPDDIQIFGFDAGEAKRAASFQKRNPEVDLVTPLIDDGIDKQDALREVLKAGIEIPVMYQQGFKNNNCIGCVKGQAGYWNRIREYYPDHFDLMSRIERKLGAAICKTEAGGVRRKIFLDELDPSQGSYESELEISCGPWCGEDADDDLKPDPGTPQQLDLFEELTDGKGTPRT